MHGSADPQIFVGTVHEDLVCRVGIIDRVCWHQHGVYLFGLRDGRENTLMFLWQLLGIINVHNEMLAG